MYTDMMLILNLAFFPSEVMKSDVLLKVEMFWICDQIIHHNSCLVCFSPQLLRVVQGCIKSDIFNAIAFYIE